MILDHLVEVDLFSKLQNQTLILNNYPTQAKQKICASVIEAITSHPEQTISSWNQINFAMEAIGACFTLQVSNSSHNAQHSAIIKSGIRIYAGWLRTTPASAKPHEEELICTIMEHCTLLFSDTTSIEKGNSEEKLKLAQMVYKMFENFIMYRFKDLNILTMGEWYKHGAY